MSRKKNSIIRGFSLIELLATIFVVSLIFGVGFYYVVNTINESKEKTRLISVSNVKSAANLYVKEYSDAVSWKKEMDQSGNYTTCIFVSDLVNKGYLKEEAINNLNLDGSITLTKNSSNTIIDAEFSNEGNCYYNRVAIPTSKKFCRELEYNASEQILTNESEYFNFSNNKGTNAGDYVVVAKLSNDELSWKDGTREDKKITCTIKKAVPYFAMHPTGISSDDIKVGGSTSVNIYSGVKGVLLDS